jgi:uncharacterized membrane protein YbhN (UPF0104 family)
MQMRAPDPPFNLLLRAVASWRRPHLDYDRRHVAAFVVTGSLLAFAALAGVAWAAGFDRIADFLSRPDWIWFPIAFAGELVAYAGYTLAYREVAGVHPLERPRFRDSLAVVAAGFGMFIARGGLSADYETLQEQCNDDSIARQRVLGLGMLEYLILAPVTCAIAILLLVTGSHVPTGFTMPWAIGVPVGFLFAAALHTRRRWFVRKRGWRSRVATALDAVGMLQRLARTPRQAFYAAFGMALYWVGDAFCLWACLRGFLGHHPLPVSTLIIGYATGYALSRRTLPLAGAGVVEALLPFALLWVSLPLAAAMLAVLAYRFFNLWLPLVPAVLGYRHLRGAVA